MLLAACPDELDADMVRFFGLLDWRGMRPSRVAPLAVAAARQPESWMRRVLDKDWQWTLEAQLLAVLVESVAGVDVGRPGAGGQDGDGGRSGEEVDRLLSAGRTATS